jgi:hypothetical protein
MKYFIFFILLAFTNNLRSQTSGVNYVQNIYPKNSITDPNLIISGNQNLSTEEIKYYNGFGTLIQKNLKKSSKNGNDLIQSFDINQFGLVENEYLPFKSNFSNGSYVADYKTACISFYSSNVTGVENDLKPFTKYEYGNSPDKPLVSKLRPGLDWHNGNKNQKTVESINNNDDEVLLWKFNLTTNKPELININPTGLAYIPLVYKTGDLKKISKIDEENLLIEDFYDIQNNLICNKVHNSDQGILETYYVYNAFGILSTIVQPEGIHKIRSNGYNFLSPVNVIDEFCFIYIHDERGRLIASKKPGVIYDKMVYNNLDHLSFLYSGNQENVSVSRIWKQNRYDDLGRLIMFGLNEMPANRTQRDLQNLVNGASIQNENRIANFPYFTTNSYSSFANNFTPLQIFIYDDYDILVNGVYPFSQGPQAVWPFLDQFEWDNNPLGKLTIQISKVLDNSNVFLETVYYYDLKGRTIIESKKTIDNNWYVKFFEYSFDGKIQKEKTYITNGLTNSIKYKFIKEYEYFPNDLLI